MAEVLFYHLTARPLERTLPELLTRTLARGWRAVVRSGREADLTTLDDHLWTFDPASFLPHGRDRGADQPIYLTTGVERPNGASLVFLVAGARVDPDEAAVLERTCLLFDGHDSDAVALARSDWRAVTGAGLPAVYWADENGRWTEKARS
ncbi:MAG: DNA polymerase III subunit chi [Pseudomonadota bacterium]